MSMVDINGVIREMTPEEIAEIESMSEKEEENYDNN